jgi:hypothetical protein
VSRRAVRRRRVVAAVLGAASAVGLGAAVASWSGSDSSNDAVAVGAVLGAPVGASATATGSRGIVVSWTAPAVQLAGAQYEVVRTSGPGAGAVVCTTTASACADSGLAVGTTYGYGVRAVLHGWESEEATATATTGTPTFVLVLPNGPYTAGAPITVASVTAMDGDAVDTAYTGDKTITWSGLATSPTPSSTAPTYPTGELHFVDGVASPASPFTAVAAGPASLTATETGTAITGSVAFAVVAAPADRLVLVAQPAAGQDIAATSTFAASVALRDPYSNVATTDTRSVTLTIGTNPSSGVLACTSTTVAAASGVASFSGCAITKAGTGYTLSATAGGPAAPTNANTFHIVHGTATKIVLTGPSTVASGAPVVLTATLTDTHGNTTTTGADATRSVTFSKSSGTATFTGLGSATAAGGVATITVTGVQAGSATLVATANLAGGASSSNGLAVSVTAGPAPTITSPTSVAPVSFGRNETKTFTIVGTNFVAGVLVTLTDTSNGYVIVSQQFVDAGQISVTVRSPDNNGNSKNGLVVTKPDGGSATSASSLVRS